MKEDFVKEEALRDDELKKEILVRLRRVEGQVKGIQGGLIRIFVVEMSLLK